MTNDPLRILVLEDYAPDAELVVRELHKQGMPFTAKCVACRDDFLAALRDWKPDVILSDYSLPTLDGAGALAAAQRECPDVPFIFVSGSLGEEAAVGTLHAGATDFVVKNRLARLGPALQRAVRERRERDCRRRAEQALRDSEQRWRLLFEFSPDAYYLHDGNGVFVDANKAAEELSGYLREECIGKSFFDLKLLTGDGLTRATALLARNQRGESAGPEEYTLRRKDNTEVEVEISSYPIELDGRALVLGIARDITARKASENAKAESLGFRKAILDNIPDPAWLKDCQGRFLECNQPLLRLLGRSKEEILGKTNRDVHPANAEAAAEEDQTVIATGKPLRTETPLVDPGGQTRWFDTIKSPIRGHAGEILGTVGIARETTERRRHEEEIQELNLLLRAIRTINQLVTQERDPQQLLACACGILAETRDYPLVWVGVPEPGNGRVTVMARKGAKVSYLDGMHFSRNDVPVGSALSDRKACVIHDMQGDPQYAPYRERACDQGFASVAGVPMIHDDKLLGVLAVYSSRQNAFHENEVALLTELASDLALGLHSIEHERERRRAEQRVTAFAYVSQRLSVARTARQAAEVIISVADQLLGLDACTLDLYSQETDRLHYVLNQDTIGGQRVECESVYDNRPPSKVLRRIMESGGRLILKERSDEALENATPFGDTSRPSASIMIVPLRDGSRINGVLSIHSYTPNAYDEQALDTLQALADHCGGALQRISTEEALSESESNYRSLVELSTDAIFIHSEEQLVYANPATLKLLRTDSLQELLGRSVLDFVPAAERDAWRQRIRNAAERGPTAPVEQRMLRLDGSEVLVEGSSIPFVYKGKPAVQTILRDITERKNLEQQLRHSQKMEGVGQLAGGVAHDFNNLLAVIRGNADLLLLTASALSADANAGLKQIVAASERAANLTRQLLIFSRKQAMDSCPLGLNEVITELTKMLKRIIGEHIDLQCRYAPELPQVRADAGMIEQALVNLAVNARDAMPRGGKLIITTETCHLTETEARQLPDGQVGDFVCLTVSDTGVGIPPKDLPHIFEPFFTTKEPGKGTGLGLATVHGIVKQHHGWIEVRSALGVGTLFKIFLPAIAATAQPAQAPPPETDLPRGTETILLVEDDYAVRLISRRMLESHGYKVYEASSAPAAMALWREHGAEVGLLLSDVVMPEGVTGRDLAELLRADRPTLKVILMSGYSAEASGKDSEFFHRSGVFFLHKPCAARTLLETVRICLDQAETKALA